MVQFRPRHATTHQAGEVEDTSGHQPGDDLAPVDASDVEHQGPVYEAELVEEDAPATKSTSLVGPVVRWVQPVVIVVRQARQHEPTVRTSKWALRQVVYVFTGVGVLAKRVFDARTNSPYRRAMRAAEAAGDWTLWGDAEERGARWASDRHKRRMDGPRLLLQRLIAFGIAIPVLAVLLLVVGVAVAASADDWSLTLSPLLGTVDAIGWLAAAVMWLFGTLAFLSPFLLVGGLWWNGKRAEAAPRWLVPNQAGDGDVMDGLPDENSIANALIHCEIPAFKKALKEGWKLHFLMPPMIDGKGWRTQIALPPATPVEEFVRRKDKLAHNLRRFPIEVWPTEPQPAVLDLWVAKPGALSGPVEPWPLLKSIDTAKSDYFKGIPVGITIKGDVIKGRLFEANWVAGGMMGSGKSTLVITALAGAMLDPIVDIDVVVMAQNADYDPMKPRLNRLVTGAGDDTVEQCMAMLYELFDDLTVRGAALREHDERAVTREIAEKDPRLRPKIVVIDECQNLFIGEHGKDAIEVVTKVMSTARKYAITLMFLTPEPSKDALPRKLISIASNKACFAIGDHQGNDAVLGSGSYKAGISAVGLTPKTDDGPGDVGTCMQRGFTGRPGLMRGFYIAQSDVHRATQRALQLRAGQQQRLEPAPVREERDLLADVGEVIGNQTVPCADIPALLAQAFPAQVLYRQMTGKQLRQLLKNEHGVQVPSTGNRWPVSPRLIAEALRERRQLSDDQL